MLSIPRDLSYNDLFELVESLSHESSATVSVPSRFQDGGRFGMSGLLIQWFAKWSRTSSSRQLKIIGSPPSTVLTKLAFEPHGCAALYFAASAVGALKFSATSAEIRKYLIPTLLAMQSSRYRDTNGSRAAHLCCFQGAANEFLLPLYSQRDEGTLRKAEGFQTLTRQMIESFEPLALRAISGEKFEYLGTLVEELFANTHDHARFDERDLVYPFGNVRGIFMRTYEYRARPTESGDDSGPLGRYLALSTSQKKFYRPSADENMRRFEHMQPRSESRDVPLLPTRVLEVTVYDTGPGLARRWAAKHASSTDVNHISVEEETNYVKACFEMHATTKRSSGFGQGLDSSLEALKGLGAFMSLRTGRLFLHQDFSKPGTSKFAPQHWYEKRPELPVTPGTSYTIAIPLSRGDQ
ncbi:hypothetical protein [Paraburkholderia sp. BCC1885]|uniref:hypothetical protein n=1 Tax=Paraburkholderia sp. BCC1885 TaxID=2562669 RepID=UPI0011826A80|nr:hypothetical protein [Paraburkholderia sp. BCC1885]